jgi:hypothetical protein
MVAKLTRLTHKIVIQLHLVAESCTICISHSMWPVQKALDTPSYEAEHCQNHIEEFPSHNPLDLQHIKTAPG